MLLPMVVIAFIFQINTWYYTIGALLLAGLIQTITIIFKYALFSQNTDLGRNGMIVFFNVLCLLLPFFWPLPVIMGIRYYFKAQNKLKEYIDDINH
jgi:putative effector of murein hydrolase